jgi:hypothetical protein
VKESFAREPLSFQRNPDDDFGLRGGERERLLFRGGEGGIFAISVVLKGKEEERSGSYWVGRELGGAGCASSCMQRFCARAKH